MNVASYSTHTMKRDTKIQIIELIIFDLFDQNINPEAELHVEHRIVDMFKKTIDFNVEMTDNGQYNEFKFTLPITEIDACKNDYLHQFGFNIAEHLLSKKQGAK